jgi:hypothetical protein
LGAAGVGVVARDAQAAPEIGVVRVESLLDEFFAGQRVVVGDVAWPSALLAGVTVAG